MPAGHVPRWRSLIPTCAPGAGEAAVGPGSAAQPGENGDLLPPVRLGMQLGAGEVGEGKERAWRVPLNLPWRARERKMGCRGRGRRNRLPAAGL